MSRVTLQTIADELGVSRTTVSNAFSRPNQLSDALRERILDTARRLGYAGPDPAARTLRSGRSGVVGVVLKESLSYGLEDPYAIEILRGVARESEPAQFGLLLIPSPPTDNITDGIKAAVADSFCVFSLPDDHPAVAEVLKRRVRTVFIDGPAVPGHSFVGIDNRSAGAEPVEHLRGLGHRRIAVLSFRLLPDGYVGPIDEDRIAAIRYRVTRERILGVLDALGGVGKDGPILYEVGLNDRSAAARAALRLLSAEAPPTAIVALSDQIALGAMEAARQLGLSVPGDVSVTGFDDIAEAETAGLTTVRQAAFEKGRVAGRLLVAGTDAEHVVLDHDLIIRRSTAPPRPSSGAS